MKQHLGQSTEQAGAPNETHQAAVTNFVTTAYTATKLGLTEKGGVGAMCRTELDEMVVLFHQIVLECISSQIYIGFHSEFFHDPASIRSDCITTQMK